MKIDVNKLREACEAVVAAADKYNQAVEDADSKRTQAARATETEADAQSKFTTALNGLASVIASLTERSDG